MKLRLSFVLLVSLAFAQTGFVRADDKKTPDQIKQEKVPAVFGSEVFPSKVLQQIATEGNAKFIDKLRDDEPPGKKDAAEHTYVGMLLEDMRIMLPALGGNADALKDLKPDNTFAR